MKKLFEFRVFDIMKDDENREFLNKVKDENPELYDRFMSLVGNKGLEIAKQKYLQYDPEWIKEQKRKKTKEEKQREKEESKDRFRQRFLDKYREAVTNINIHLARTPLRDVIYIIREEKNLKRWKKQYKTLFKDVDSSLHDMENEPIDSVKIIPPYYRYRSEFGDEHIEIKQYVNLDENKKKIKDVKFTIIFHFEPEGFDEFEADRDIKIGQLTTYIRLNLNELKELLEKFKYYMSDEYRKNWEIEQETEKYNL